MSNRKVGPIEVTADKVVCGLIDRLIANEKKMEALQREVQANFDSMVEHIPCEVEGGIQFKVFNADKEAPADETYKRVTLPGKSVAIDDWTA